MSGAGRSAGEAAEHLFVTAQTGGTEAIDMLLSVVWRPRRIWPRAPWTCSARATHGDPQLLATVIGLFTRTAASARPRPLPQLCCHTTFLLRRRPPSGSRCDRPEHYWYAHAALTEATRALALPDLPGRLQADLTAAVAAARVQLRDLQGAERCVSESLRLGPSKNAGPPTGIGNDCDLADRLPPRTRGQCARGRGSHGTTRCARPARRTRPDLSVPGCTVGM